MSKDNGTIEEPVAVSPLADVIEEAKKQLQTITQQFEALSQRRQQLIAALEATTQQLAAVEKKRIEADGILRGVTAAQQRLDATSRKVGTCRT